MSVNLSTDIVRMLVNLTRITKRDKIKECVKMGKVLCAPELSYEKVILYSVSREILRWEQIGLIIWLDCQSSKQNPLNSSPNDKGWE